jgi:predicted ATPase
MNGIGFKNMKVFKERQWFDFKPITLLTGTNNSGKSSVINAMQMLQQNLPNNYNSTIDDLVRTKFKLSKNQHKYGSIKNFVHRDAKEQLNHFVFYKRNNNVQYNILVDINDGIDSYGQVKIIAAIDPKSEEKIFSINIAERTPTLVCQYRINYKYFLDKFKRKCLNTIQLHDDSIRLNELVDLVNKKIEPISKLVNFADEISNTYQVYIHIFESIDSDDVTMINCFILNEPNYTDYRNEFKEFEELGVFFEEVQNENGLKYNPSLVSKDILIEWYNSNIFDIDKLFENLESFDKLEFENQIINFYKKDRTESFKDLNDDIIEYLSNIGWEIEEIYSEEDPLLVPYNLIHTYLNCNPDFGLIAACVGRKRENDEYGRKDFTGSNIENRFLIANLIEYKNTDEIKEKRFNNFSNNIFDKIRTLIFNNFKILNVKNRDSLIYDVFKENINKEFEKILFKINLGFNCTYVSSTRFQEKRAYNVNDNSNFSSLIRTIESLSGQSKNDCFSFINKWLNEFEIAEEIILTPDSETGDFKAHLKVNGNNVLLADFGLGTNQLLPVIFSLGIHVFQTQKYFPYEIVMSERTVVIEEPEANLHPAMQSKLADLFVDAYQRFKVQVIIETHSEYLIRKLQYLVGSNISEIKPDDILIYYFYKSNHQAVLDKQVNQVEKIQIDDYGRLSKEFGSGFFDEADRIALDIFLLKQSQSN